MTYQIIQPSARLNPYVRFFWVFEYNIPSGKPYVYRSMADGCAEFIFHYKGVFNEVDQENSLHAARSLVHAQTKRFRRFETQDNFGIFGAYLYPFTLARLLRLPMTEVCDKMIDVESLFGAAGKYLEEQIMTAPDTTTRVEVLSGFLEKRLFKNNWDESSIFSSIKYVVHSELNTPVDRLAGKFNLSRRQFERRFKEFSGFSPGLYSRIIRFSNTIKEYGNRNKTLTQIALECGYYDQSHFIHEFKAFSGYHPKEYFKGRPEGIEYMDP